MSGQDETHLDRKIYLTSRGLLRSNAEVITAGGTDAAVGAEIVSGKFGPSKIVTRGLEGPPLPRNVAIARKCEPRSILILGLQTTPW
ncbi:hypothetical protein QQX98_002780 [Neonectria punicea]|uniref:Uncharacterized protein n=1 Tax=Neonectria punicea TaxID=979145 RepID=A0ABR1HGU9_9HYPO